MQKLSDWIQLYTLYKRHNAIYLILFFGCIVAHGILVPWLEIGPMLPTMEVWSPNHWTAREIPETYFKFKHTDTSKV